MLETRNLGIKYQDGHVAVKDLNIAIGKGEAVGILGANGAGKSTFLHSIVGAVTISSGSISIDGVEVNRKNMQEIRKRVGLIFQNPDDQLFMTHVYEDVAFGLRNLGFSEQEVDERVRKVLERLSITHLMKRVPAKLSGGEKRLAAMAGIVALEPDIILFDEPTCFLDPRSKRQLIPLVQSLEGTKLIATHDFDFAEAACDRILVIKEGQLMADGRTKDILNDTVLLESCGL